MSQRFSRVRMRQPAPGAAAWAPANHHARAEGIEDSPELALAYLRATAPPGWRETEDPLWRSFVTNAPEMLEFVEANTPLRFSLTNEPDVFADSGSSAEIVGRKGV